MPDTSPRGDLVEGQKEDWDFGEGAAYYLNATTIKWKKYWNMDSYITEELPRVVDQLFSVDNSRKGIFGHSVGGHGAMALFFRNPGMYKSISAFNPVCNPSNC